MLRKISNVNPPVGGQMSNKEGGFTLVELVVVIAVMSFLGSMVLYFVRPFYQFQKANDSKRQQDFREIRTALDAYYNDHNCYPTTLSFGGEWKEANTVYMKKMPQDPTCGQTGGKCYLYVIDTNSSCPQWHVLFGKLALSIGRNQDACPLDTSCFSGAYFSDGYNFCDVGGNVNCSFTPPLPTPTVTPTITPGGPVYICACGAGNITVCNISYSAPTGVTTYTNPSCDNQCGQPC